jgi:hypothetical protein
MGNTMAEQIGEWKTHETYTRVVTCGNRTVLEIIVSLLAKNTHSTLYYTFAKETLNPQRPNLAIGRNVPSVYENVEYYTGCMQHRNSYTETDLSVDHSHILKICRLGRSCPRNEKWVAFPKLLSLSVRAYSIPY